jgi:hypothetical protein
MSHDEELKTEALRLYRRYLDEVALAYDLCPWATSALATGKVEERVVLGGTEAIAKGFRPTILELAQTQLEVVLLIFPELDLPRADFERFTQKLRSQATGPEDPLNTFALATFHPQADANTQTSERLIPFLRRTPDPTLQLVRYSVLEAVREGTPQGTEFVDFASLDLKVLPAASDKTLRERIADKNLRTVERAGVDTITLILEDILRDREQAYARLRSADSPP